MTNDDEREICDTCKFWEYLGTEGNGIDYGLCRRHAPRPTITEGTEMEKFVSWPLTAEVDWCGEFQKLDTPAEQE